MRGALSYLLRVDLTAHAAVAAVAAAAVRHRQECIFLQSLKSIKVADPTHKHKEKDMVICVLNEAFLLLLSAAAASSRTSSCPKCCCS